MPKSFTNEDFIRKAREVHGGNYEYLEPYNGMNNPLAMRCLKHLIVFSLKPYSHLYDLTGCKLCGNENRRNKKRMPEDAVIKKAEEVHGVGRYDYTESRFQNISDKANIICHKIGIDGKEHGMFSQKMLNHIYNKQGCPKCKAESNRKPIFGIGINDINIDTDSVVYVKWYQMFNRCYGKANKTYKDCFVCEEWHYLSNFKKWFENPENGYRDGYHLDKDILVKGNREYAPDKCCFVPNVINGHFKQFNKNKTGLPRGVQMRHGRYFATISNNGEHKYLGYYNTPMEAFNAFKEAQENKYKGMAQEYFDRGEITKKVYDALMRYEVEPDD